MPPTLLTDDPINGPAFWGEIQDNPMSHVLRTDDPADGQAFWDHVDCSTECADTIAAAVAAERLRANSWFSPGRDLPGLTWSDPSNLASAYSLNPATGVVEVTAEPGIVTPNVSELLTGYAGWDGQLAGKVLGQPFTSSPYGVTLRLTFDPTTRPPIGTDIEIAVMIANGPRATATYGYTARFIWATASAANTSRVYASQTRALASPAVGASLGNTTLTTLLGASIPGSTPGSFGVRPLASNGSLLFSPTNGGTQSGTQGPWAQAEWGPETWVFFGVGRRVGNNVAPNNTPLTVRFYADILYQDADFTSASLPPW